jgi:hypothetical protein
LSDRRCIGRNGITLGAGRSRVIHRLRPDASLLPRSSAESRRIVIRDAAAILGCSPAIVRRLLNDGMLHGRRFTVRGIRVTRESLLKLIRWLEASEEDERVRPSRRRRGKLRKERI